MAEYLRDAVLATLTGAVLLSALALSGGRDALARPTAAAGGIAAALVVEWSFLADTPARSLWQRRRVRFASVATVAGGGVALAWLAGPWILAAACWGLATYFALLALVVAGVWGGDGPERDVDGD